MGWDDLIDLGLVSPVDYWITTIPELTGLTPWSFPDGKTKVKSIRRGRYQLHLARFTGETGWYRCEERDFSRMEPGTCAHFEVKEPDFITSCTRWTRTPEQISQMLIEDKGD
ncbi:MAG: hypothetical protein ACLUB2_01540 [Butyricicoccus pullicaecorum]